MKITPVTTKVGKTKMTLGVLLEIAGKRVFILADDALNAILRLLKK